MNSSAQAAGWHREIAQPPLAVHRCRRCHLFCASGSSLLMRLALLQYTSPRGAVHLCEVVQAMDLSRLEAQLGHACVCQTSVCAAKRSACAPRLFGTSHRSNAKARWRAGVDARRPLHSALSFEATRGISLQFTKAFVLNQNISRLTETSSDETLREIATSDSFNMQLATRTLLFATATHAYSMVGPMAATRGLRVRAPLMAVRSCLKASHTSLSRH